MYVYKILDIRNIYPEIISSFFGFSENKKRTWKQWRRVEGVETVGA